MAITSSMGTNKLYIRKGDKSTWVDYSGTLDSAAPVAQVIAGRVFSLTAGGKLEPGLRAAASSLPFFALSGLDANNYPDVSRPAGHPRSGAVQFATVSAFAAVELVTTGFAFAASTYAPGDALTASSNATTNRGVIGKRNTGASGVTVASATIPGVTGTASFTSANTDPIIGYVSPAGVYDDADGNKVLAFYPTFVAGSTLATCA